MSAPLLAGAPGAPVYGAGAPVYTAVAPDVSGFTILATLPGVYVAEDIQLWEVLGACEMENKFSVFALDPATQSRVGMPIFRAREKSDCLHRQCCGPARAFNMEVATCDPARSPFMHLMRPFKCTCACFNRGVLYTQSAAHEDLGEVYNPWACCSFNYEIRSPTTHRGTDYGPVRTLPQIESDGKIGKWYDVEATACQPGLFCSLPCGPCKEIVFDIKDGKTGAVCGKLAKVWSSCAKEALTDKSNFICIFPPDATPYQKATLLSAVFLIDFTMFEENRKPRDGDMGGAGGGGGF